MEKRTSKLPVYGQLAQAIAGEETDFRDYPGDEVALLAERHGVAPLLAHWFHEGRITGLEEAIAARLQHYARSRGLQDLVLNNDTRNFLELLHEHDIPVLLLKGTPLAMLVYDRPFLRERCDSDVYIRETDVEALGELLAGRGYTVHNLGYRPASSKQFQASIRTTRQVSTFDIHFRVSSSILFLLCLPFDACWEHRQSIPNLGPDAWALSAVDLLLHACIHRIAHFRNAERDRLLWLYDIHLLWTTMDEAERETFIKKALAKKIGAVCADALKTCDELFNTLGGASAAIPSTPRYPGIGAVDIRDLSPLTRLLQNQADEPTAPLVNAGKLRWAWADFLAIEGLRSKAVFARELIFKR